MLKIKQLLQKTALLLSCLVFMGLLQPPVAFGVVATDGNPGTGGGGPGTSGGGGGGSSSSGTCDDSNGLCADCASEGSKNKNCVCKTKNCGDDAAKDASNPDADCSAKGCDLVQRYVNPGINLLSVVFGIIAVISLILGGIQYTTSEGDPQKTAKAKGRIVNTLFACLAFLFLWAFLQFLVPGGLFDKNP